MAVPTREDATLMIQIAQWMATLGVQDHMAKLWDDEFDPEDVDPKSTPVQTVLGVFETIATLTKNGLLSEELVRDWIWVEGIWAKVGPSALKAREKTGEPRLYENFEALATKA